MPFHHQPHFGIRSKLPLVSIVPTYVVSLSYTFLGQSIYTTILLLQNNIYEFLHRKDIFVERQVDEPNLQVFTPAHQQQAEKE